MARFPFPLSDVSNGEWCPRPPSVKQRLAARLLDEEVARRATSPRSHARRVSAHRGRHRDGVHGPEPRRILGLNAARLYGIDPRARRCTVDGIDRMRAEQGGFRAGRSLRAYGPRTRREFLALLAHGARLDG